MEAETSSNIGFSVGLKSRNNMTSRMKSATTQRRPDALGRP